MVTFCLFRARENSFRFFSLLVRLFELHSSHPGVSFKRDTLFTICLRVVAVIAAVVVVVLVLLSTFYGHCCIVLGM